MKRLIDWIWPRTSQGELRRVYDMIQDSRYRKIRNLCESHKEWFVA